MCHGWLELVGKIQREKRNKVKGIANLEFLKVFGINSSIGFHVLSNYLIDSYKKPFRPEHCFHCLEIILLENHDIL